MMMSRFSPTPALRTETGERIAEINLAAQVLLGRDLAGCRRKPISRLLDNLASRLDTEFLPPNIDAHWRTDTKEHQAERDWVMEKQVVYQSDGFGRVDLRNLLVPYFSPSNGVPQGMLLYCHILAIEDAAKFWEALTERWNHELMWNVLAISYDRVLPRLPFYRDLVQAHVSGILAAGGGDVLDLGAGSGNVSVPLLEAGCRVTAVDLGETMLAHLRAKVSDEFADRLTVIEENAESLPDLSDASFDGVTISHALYDMENPEAAWQEALRVLRPGGVIVVTEPNGQSFDLRHLLESGERSLREQGLYEELKSDWARIYSAGHELKIKDRSARLRPQEIRDRLEAAGYHRVSIQDAYLGSCSTVVGYKPDKPAS